MLANISGKSSKCSVLKETFEMRRRGERAMRATRRWGEGATRRQGEGEMGRWGDKEMWRCGDVEIWIIK